MTTRRNLVKSSLALPWLATPGRALFGAVDTLAEPDDCGVASGDPRPDSVVLWTRLGPRARLGSGPSESIPVGYEVAREASFAPRSIVARGEAVTHADRDFTVKVKAEGLDPLTTYFYRFTTADGYTSVTGRTRTAPAPGTRPERVKLALVTCQNFSDGPYTAYDHLAREDVDFCLHLGDHIYELERGRRREHPLAGREARTLADYRAKYRLYLSDPAWREVRRLFPWIDIWDDHEVFNDYAGAYHRHQDPARFAAAYQAFLEYMPFESRLDLGPGGVPELKIHRSLAFGDLLEVFATDQRQHRTPPPCGPWKYATPGCRGMGRDDHTMLGAAQKGWLLESLGASRATWKIVMNEVLMAPMRVLFRGREAETQARLLLGDHMAPATTECDLYLNLDQWDGYPVERAELLGFVERERLANVVVATGDIHAAIDARLFTDPQRSRGTAAAVEIVTPSLSSTPLGRSLGSWASTAQRSLHRTNPHFVWSDMVENGYTLLTATAEGALVEHVAVGTLPGSGGGARVMRSLKIPVGRADFLT